MYFHIFCYRQCTLLYFIRPLLYLLYRRLEKERKETQLTPVQQDSSSLKTDKASLRKTYKEITEKVTNMKGAVPGIPVVGEKDWVVGKYGRALPIVHLRKKGKFKLTKVDPSKLCHNLKKLKDATNVDELKVPVDALTWNLVQEKDHSLKEPKHDKYIDSETSSSEFSSDSVLKENSHSSSSHKKKMKFPHLSESRLVTNSFVASKPVNTSTPNMTSRRQDDLLSVFRADNMKESGTHLDEENSGSTTDASSGGRVKKGSDSNLGETIISQIHKHNLRKHSTLEGLKNKRLKLMGGKDVFTQKAVKKSGEEQKIGSKKLSCDLDFAWHKYLESSSTHSNVFRILSADKDATKTCSIDVSASETSFHYNSCDNKHGTTSSEEKGCKLKRKRLAEAKDTSVHSLSEQSNDTERTTEHKDRSIIKRRRMDKTSRQDFFSDTSRSNIESKTSKIRTKPGYLSLQSNSADNIDNFSSASAVESNSESSDSSSFVSEETKDFIRLISGKEETAKSTKLTKNVTVDKNTISPTSESDSENNNSAEENDENSSCEKFSGEENNKPSGESQINCLDHKRMSSSSSSISDDDSFENDSSSDSDSSSESSSSSDTVNNSISGHQSSDGLPDVTKLKDALKSDRSNDPKLKQSSHVSNKTGNRTATLDKIEKDHQEKTKYISSEEKRLTSILERAERLKLEQELIKGSLEKVDQQNTQTKTSHVMFDSSDEENDGNQNQEKTRESSKVSGIIK